MFIIDFIMFLFFFFHGISFIKKYLQYKNILYPVDIRAYSYGKKGIQLFLSTKENPFNAIQVKKKISLRKLNQLKKKKLYAILELDSYNNEFFSLTNHYKLLKSGLFLLFVSFVFLFIAFYQFYLN